MIRQPVGRFHRGGKERRAAARRLWIPHAAPNASRGRRGMVPRCIDGCRSVRPALGDGQLVRTDELPLLGVGIIARHGSLGSILPLFGIRIVLKRFARAR